MGRGVFRVARAGALSVPISYDSTEPEIAYRLSDASCKAVITTGERSELFARLKSAAPNLKTLIVTDRGHCHDRRIALFKSGRDQGCISSARPAYDA